MKKFEKLRSLLNSIPKYLILVEKERGWLSSKKILEIIENTIKMN